MNIYSGMAALCSACFGFNGALLLDAIKDGDGDSVALGVIAVAICAVGIVLNAIEAKSHADRAAVILERIKG